jgi:hypothetical protein
MGAARRGIRTIRSWQGKGVEDLIGIVGIPRSGGKTHIV